MGLCLTVSKYLKANCRSRNGGTNEIRVLDLSEAGCMINKRMLLMEPGDRVLVKMEGLTYLPCNVLWAEDEEAGLAFEQPLYGPVLEHLQRSFVVDAEA